MKSQHEGQTTLVLAGKLHTVCFDWAALAKCQAECGKDAMRAILRSPEPEGIAKMLAIGLQKHHAGMTPEQIMEASPPLMEAVAAIDEALAIAYFGPEEAARISESKKKILESLEAMETAPEPETPEA